MSKMIPKMIMAEVFLVWAARCARKSHLVERSLDKRQ